MLGPDQMWLQTSAGVMGVNPMRVLGCGSKARTSADTGQHFGAGLTPRKNSHFTEEGRGRKGLPEGCLMQQHRGIASIQTQASRLLIQCSSPPPSQL